MFGTGYGAFSLTQIGALTNYNISTLPSLPAPTTLHPDTIDWKNRASATGGTFEDTDLQAIDTFVRGCYDSGLRDRTGQNHLILELLPFAGNNLAAALTKLWYPPSAPTLTNVNFVAGDYSKTSGLTGDAGNKTLRSGFNPVTVGLQSDASIGVYNRTNGAMNTLEVDGGIDANQRFLMHAHYLDNNCYFDCFDAFQGRVSASVASSSLGFILGSRTSNGSALYRNGTLLASTATSGGTIPNTEVKYFAPSPRTLGLILLGRGIPSELVPRLNELVQNLMTAFGRAV